MFRMFTVTSLLLGDVHQSVEQSRKGGLRVALGIGGGVAGALEIPLR